MGQPTKVTPFGDRRALQNDGLDIVQGPACAADISDDGKVNVEDLLALLASYGSSCVKDASRGALECDTTINLDQLADVSVALGETVDSVTGEHEHLHHVRFVLLLTPMAPCPRRASR